MKHKNPNKTKDISRKIKNIPEEMIELFKSVADLCDGVEYRTMKKFIEKDYERILKTDWGIKLYSKLIDANIREKIHKKQ